MDQLEFPLFGERVAQIHHSAGGSVLEAMRPYFCGLTLMLGQLKSENYIIQPCLISQPKGIVLVLNWKYSTLIKQGIELTQIRS